MTVVWINGPFGVGKTTASTQAVEALDGWRIFDPEEVGFMLRANLADHEFSDFQELPPWRALVPRCMAEVQEFTGQDLIAVQTIIVEQYWYEIKARLVELGVRVRLIVLTSNERTLLERIDGDDELPSRVKGWRRRHIEPFRSATEGWLRREADLMVDTSSDKPEDTADLLVKFINGLQEEGP